MDKKAQLTIFIILGFVILIIVGGFFVIQSMTLGKTAEEEAKEIVGTPLQPVRAFVDECIKQTAEDALLLIGLHGGYISIPENVKQLDTFYGPIAYWYYEAEDTRPFLAKIEEQANDYIDANLANCTKGFEDFLGITFGSIKTETKIAEKSVVINANYPVGLKQGENSYEMSKFRVELPIRLGMILEDVNSIVDMELILNDVVDLTYLGELEMDIAMYRYADDILLYGIKDELSLMKSVPYAFVFANKFILAEEQANNAPQLTNTHDLTAVVGQALNYDFEAADKDGDSLIFSAIGIIDIAIDENTGVLTYTPAADDIGENEVDVKVSDGELSDTQTITITVS